MSITTFCKGHIAGWSEWFGSPNSTGELIILKSDNNVSITQICATFEANAHSDSKYTCISAYFSDNHAVTAGSPFSKRRLCTDSVNEGQCFTSVYVTYDDSFVWGLQLMTSDNILLSWLGRSWNSGLTGYTWPGNSASTASAMPNQCLTGIAVYFATSAITRIRFHFSEAADLGGALTVTNNQISTTQQQPMNQISATQRTSVTTKQQPVVINIEQQSNDASQTSNIILIVILAICVIAMAYKIWGYRCQRFIVKNDDENHMWLKQWLTDSVCLEQYYQHFAANGYEQKDFVTQIKKTTELEALGIVKKAHQKHILQEIEKLRIEKKREALDVIELKIEDEDTKRRNEGLEYTSVQVSKSDDDEA
eukprot:44671_1